MKVQLMLFFSLILVANTVLAGTSAYCDVSAGRQVLDNGYYSKQYCRKTAVMNLQNVSACCAWHGGVLTAKDGIVVCTDGSVSPICSTQATKEYQSNQQTYQQESRDYFNFN